MFLIVDQKDTYKRKKIYSLKAIKKSALEDNDFPVN